MSDEHGGGGGGEAKFFFGIVAGLLLLWVFGLYRNGELFVSPLRLSEQQEVDVVESRDEEVSRPTPATSVSKKPTSRPSYTTKESQPPLPQGHPPLAEHGITYYLDRDGEIIDIYRY